MKGDRITIPAAQIEFVEGGNTIWVHGPQGATILRIKLQDDVIGIDECQASPNSHLDLIAVGNKHLTVFCLGEDAEVQHVEEDES